uniref:Amino acid transporter n=1 Tax=Panagrellus redivivus TaxID=6233 RepID=A0A7E4UQY8_PANRE
MTSPKLNLVQCIAYCVGDIIGSGIFVTPAYVLSNTHSAWLSLVVWVIGGVISALAACVYIEFATTCKRSGGDFAFLLYTGWRTLATAFYVVGSCFTYPCLLAIQIIAFGSYFLQFLGEFFTISLSTSATLHIQRLIGFCVLLPILFVNLFSLKTVAARFQIFATATKLVIVAAVIFSGVYHFAFVSHRAIGLENAPFFDQKTTAGGIVLGIFSCIFSFNGWALLPISIEEVGHPKRNLPISTAIGLIVSTAVYVLMNASYLTVLTADEFKSAETVITPFFIRVFNTDFIGKIVPFLICLVLIGSLNCTIFGSSRYTVAGSRRGILPSIFGALHSKSKSPRPAVLIQGFITICISFLGSLNDLINYTSFTFALQQLCISCALIWVKWQRRNDTKIDPDIFEIPVIVPMLYAVVALVITIIPFTTDWRIPMYGTVMFIIGLAVHFLILRRKRLPRFLKVIDEKLLTFARVALDCHNPDFESLEPQT